MKRYIWGGLVLFMGFAITFIPSSVINPLISAHTPAKLVTPSGSIWGGSGRLLWSDFVVGEVTWNFLASSLWHAQIGYRLELMAADKTLAGELSYGAGQLSGDLQGTFDLIAANAWLQRYDIAVDGPCQIDPTDFTLELSRRIPAKLEGLIRCTRSNARYRLSGVNYQARLPPVEIRLSTPDAQRVEASVYTKNVLFPVLIASLDNTGMAKVEVTRLFTQMLGNPWPESGSDSAIVIEVEEQIL